MKNNSFSCVGIDVCKGELVAVYITENLFEVEKFKSINDICRRYSNSDSYIIDIPVSLVENKSQLRSELIVKKELGRKD